MAMQENDAEKKRIYAREIRSKYISIALILVGLIVSTITMEQIYYQYIQEKDDNLYFKHQLDETENLQNIVRNQSLEIKRLNEEINNLKKNIDNAVRPGKTDFLSPPHRSISFIRTDYTPPPAVINESSNLR